jgi:selenocysteine lyase/cysteine desulfurase
VASVRPVADSGGATSVLPSVHGADLQVPLADGMIAAFANFDHASTPPCLRAVADAVSDFLPWYASTHRGSGTLSEMCTSHYEECRRVVHGFVGARPDDHVVFTRNTTDALNLLARCVPDDMTVLVFGHEHHANLLPWRKRRVLPICSTHAALVETLDRALVDLDGPALLSVTAAVNVTGELLPLDELVAVARAHRALVAVDAAQWVAHRPIDMAALDVDFLGLSGHKMYAPFGIGALAGRGAWLAQADPYLRGGGATQFVSDDAGRVEWRTGESRHEAGTANVVGAVALATACRTLSAASATLMPYEAVLAGRLRSGLNEIPEYRELSLFGPESERLAIVSFVVEGVDPGLLASVLSVEYGIGVRHGGFCAQPLTRHLLRATSPAGPTTAVRASLGLGLGIEQVDRLVDAARSITEIGPQLFYTNQDGAWTPGPDGARRVGSLDVSASSAARN